MGILGWRPGVVAAAATGLHRGPLTLPPAERAGYAALNIPRPCAFHARKEIRMNAMGTRS
jgi:hypothetical protein